MMAIYVLSQLLVISTFLSISISIDVSGPNVIPVGFEKRSVNGENYGSSLRRRQNPVAVDLENQFYSYLATINVGTPPQPMTIEIVTDSDVTWIPDLSSPLCQNDKTQCHTGGAFNSSASTTLNDYGPGSFGITYPGGTQSNGDFINDLVMLGNATLTKTTLGLATNGSVTSGVIGILGLGSGAAGGTGSGGSANYTNILDTLKSQAYINTRAFSLWLNDAGEISPQILMCVAANHALRCNCGIPAFRWCRYGQVSWRTQSIICTIGSNLDWLRSFPRTNVCDHWPYKQLRADILFLLGRSFSPYRVQSRGQLHVP